MEPPHEEQEKIERLRRAMYSREYSGKIKERQRRPLSPSREDVGEDWDRPEPGTASSMVAPRRINLARSLLWWLLAAAAVFFVGAVLFFVYFFTLGGGSAGASVSNIDIAVNGPPQIAGGEATELQIAVTNRNSVPLELADLIVTYPDGTRSVTDYSTPLPTLRQDLGTIPAGSTRQGTVSAVFAGTSGEHSDVKVELEYHLSGSNAVFTASSDYAFVFSSSPLSISVAGNTQTVSGQPLQLAVTVSSNATAPVKDVLLSAQYPFGFKATSASPAPAADGLWNLGDLNPGDARTITLEGVLTGNTGDTRIFNFTAGTNDSATSTTITTPLAANPFTLTVAQPFMSLDLAINGASGSSIVVQPNDPVNVVVNYQNNLTTAITDAVVVAKLSGVQINGSTVSSNDGFYRSGDDTVLWDKTTTNGTLSNIPAGGKGTLMFSFNAPSSALLSGASNPYIDITINAAGNLISETGVPQSLQSTSEEHIGIASDLQLAANGLYYTSPYGSTGPMPPQANQETTYAMVLTLTNTTNEISGATVTATLPSYVRWTGKSSPPNEDITFNQQNSTVTWNVGTIAPGVGINGTQPRQVGFEIGFTPSTSQIGQEPPLLQDITLTGTDAATGQTITRTASDVTTNILGDAGFNSSNATVVK